MKSFHWESLFQHHPLFSALARTDLDRLLAEAAERTYEPGAAILREGDVGDSLFVIGSGTVQIVLHGSDQAEIVLSTLPPGEIFGEMAILSGQPRSATVIAAQACTVLEIQGQGFLRLLDHYPDMHMDILQKVHERGKRAGQASTA